jgi:hypothetical protein
LDYYFVLKDKDDLIKSYNNNTCGLSELFPDLLKLSGKSIKSYHRKKGDTSIMFNIAYYVGWYIPRSYFKGILNINTYHNYFCLNCDEYFSTIDCPNCDSDNYKFNVLRSCDNGLCFEESIRNILTKAFI